MLLAIKNHRNKLGNETLYTDKLLLSSYVEFSKTLQSNPPSKNGAATITCQN